MSPPGEGATDDQILEYALFVSKVEAAAKGCDKLEDKKRLKERLEAYGFEEKKTRDDGNCQFCAVSDQLYGHEDEQANIRATVIGWLFENRNWNPSGQEFGELHRFINDEPWDDYLRRMATDKQWGDHLTLIAMSEIFRVAICIISSVPGDKFITHIIPGARESLHSGRRGTIYLAHHLELHYISIRELQDVTLSISGYNAARPALSPFLPPATSLPFPQMPAPVPATAASPQSGVVSVYQGFRPTLKLILVSSVPPEARRIPLERWPSLQELDCLIGEKFGKRAAYAYSLKYKDEDGDLVSIVNQSELADAINFVEQQRTILALEIHPAPPGRLTVSSIPSPPTMPVSPAPELVPLDHTATLIH